MDTEIGTSPEDIVELAFADTSPRLWRAIFAYTCDREITSDAVAEAFAQVLRRGAAVRDVRAWVWTAAFRIAAHELRSKAVLGEPPERIESEPSIERIHLLSALAELSRMQRATLVLRYYAGYSTVDIARILATSAGAVRVHLNRGRKRLRRILEAEEQ